MPNMPPVIVFRASDICYLGIIRSLGKLGLPFESVTFTWPSADSWWSEESIFSKNIVNYSIPNPYEFPQDALFSLVEVGKKLFDKWKIPLLAIPSSDTNLMFLLDHEAELSKYFCLMGDKNFASYRRDIVNKATCSQALQAFSSHLVPRSIGCNDLSDVDHVSQYINYPCVYKPATKDYSQSFYSMHNGSKAIECYTPDELKAGLKKSLSSGYELIIQEKIDFDRVEDEIPFYAYVDSSGAIKMASTGVKELIQPYPFGTANILRLSWHQELFSIASEVVSALQWRGILMIEFIKDKRDGCWKVIEVNTRPWLFIGFYERFGLNYLRLLYDDWLYQTVPETCILPSSEILNLSPIHFDLGGIKKYSTKSFWGSISNDLPHSLLNWLYSYSSAITHTYYDLCDPDPGYSNLQSLGLTYSQIDTLIASMHK